MQFAKEKVNTSYFIKFCWASTDNLAIFIPLASVNAPPNPIIFWY